MMELDLDNMDLHKRVNRYEDAESSLRQSGYSVLRGWRQNRRYSDKLRDLVEDCVRLDPKRRPTPAELVARTQSGLKPFAEEFRRTQKAEKVRLN